MEASTCLTREQIRRNTTPVALIRVFRPARDRESAPYSPKGKHNLRFRSAEKPLRQRTLQKKNASPARCSLSQSAQQFRRVDCKNSEFPQVCRRFLVEQSARGSTILPAKRRTIRR